MSRSPELPRTSRLTCRAWCRPTPALRAHHDRLLRVEADTDAMLDLFELAVTWAELEYPTETMIAPPDWIGFAERHRWRDPERVLRIFSLATDVASRGRSRGAATRAPRLGVAGS